MRLVEIFAIVDGRLDIRQSPLAHPPPDCKNIVGVLRAQDAFWLRVCMRNSSSLPRNGNA
jgi:hypothetical protein